MGNEHILSSLATEQVNEKSRGLDEMSTLQIVRLMNEANGDVIRAIEEASSSIAWAVDEIASRLQAGGRLIYMGAGTSGRLGIIDAAECPPTFGVDSELIQGIIAGGDGALRHAVEGAEDSPQLGREDLMKKKITDKDVVIAISASGYAPYCVGALEYAAEVGALPIAMSCNKNAIISKAAQIAIEAPTGAEVLSGSTRLKAGTATKIILNIISTAAMVRMGKVYGNLMVDVRATNVKLKDRAVRIVMNATGLCREDAQRLHADAQGNIKAAIVMHETGAEYRLAVSALEECGGYVRAAINALQ